MTDREKLCREFTELTGGHWHESVASGKDITCICDDCGKVHGNPTYGYLFIPRLTDHRTMMPLSQHRHTLHRQPCFSYQQRKNNY